jgi:choline dehydrogenase-like flavoprotein
MEVLDRTWDVVVIGSGVGGGLVARRLTELGLSVLVIEKGRDLGDTGSEMAPPASWTRSDRLEDGCWPEPLVGHLDGRKVELEAVIGAAVGGTSLRYAATLERPEPHDLDDSDDRPHPTGGWPVTYSEFEPHFERAEKYFCLSGEIDPLASGRPPLPFPPRAMDKIGQGLRERLQNAGLHPYQTHMAALFVDDCQNCFGTRCPKRCKMDGRSAGVLPALASGRAAVLADCTVLSINAGDRVISIRCKKGDQEFLVSARRYVLSAGGLGSPSLLLRSRNESWPDGIGNRHDLVGRNLMFHLSEILAVWPDGQVSRTEHPPRSLCFRDLYYCHDTRLGLVQSMGLKAGYGEILYAAQLQLATSMFRNIPLMKQALRVPAYLAASLLGPAHLFVGILEDFPLPQNRVLVDLANPDRLEFDYSITDELQARRKLFRRKMAEAYAGLRRMFMAQAPQINFAHPCGTARFGLDPRTSVLDRDCRVHGISNLFVVDSSFMPTSNCVNPSLTIGANALRVAERIAASMHVEEGAMAMA